MRSIAEVLGRGTAVLCFGAVAALALVERQDHALAVLALSAIAAIAIVVTGGIAWWRERKEQERRGSEEQLQNDRVEKLAESVQAVSSGLGERLGGLELTLDQLAAQVDALHGVESKSRVSIENLGSIIVSGLRELTNSEGAHRELASQTMEILRDRLASQLEGSSSILADLSETLTAVRHEMELARTDRLAGAKTLVKQYETTAEKLDSLHRIVAQSQSALRGLAEQSDSSATMVVSALEGSQSLLTENLEVLRKQLLDSSRAAAKNEDAVAELAQVVPGAIRESISELRSDLKALSPQAMTDQARRLEAQSRDLALLYRQVDKTLMELPQRVHDSIHSANNELVRLNKQLEELVLKQERLVQTGTRELHDCYARLVSRLGPKN